jgi:glycine/D-amino acid oxidase-like deaminating enzyme
VTVLEARHVGAGSSSRTAAGIRQQFSTPGTVHGMRYAVRFYRAFQEEVEDGTSPIVQNGYLFLYDDPERLAAAAEVVGMQQRCGLREVELLEGAALRERFPWVAPELVGATYCPTDGFLLPHLVYNEAARRVRELGGTIVQNALVTGVEERGAEIGAVLTSRGRFAADLFLDCTNAWTRRTAEALGAEVLPVEPLKRYLWFLERDGALSEDELARMPLVIGPEGVYCRPENRGTLLVGKKHDTAPEWSFTWEDQDVIEPRFAHDGGVDAVPYAVWAELAAAVPAVGEFAGFRATACGYYGTTPDHNPFLGYDRQRPNLIRLVGFSGHGAMFGPFTARVAERLAEGGPSTTEVEVDGSRVSLEAFRPGRAFVEHERMVI